MARSSSNCCYNLPYFAVLSAIVAAVGLATWWMFFQRAYQNANDALTVLGVSYSNMSKFRSNAMVYLIVACVDLVVLLLLAVWRSKLLCKRDGQGTRPSSGSSYKFLASIWSLLHFLMVVWVAINLAALASAVTTLSLGYFAGKNAADTLNKLSGATDILTEVGTLVKSYDQFAATGGPASTLLQPIRPTVEKLRPYVNAGNTSCAPFCLDMKSFKFLTITRRCICDGKTLAAAGEQARLGAIDGAHSLAGGLILFVGMVWLLMNLCGQLAGANSDTFWSSQMQYTTKPSQFTAV